LTIIGCNTIVFYAIMRENTDTNKAQFGRKEALAMENFFRFFTERQKEVYRLREQKMTFVQIGDTLGISQNAARQHYQNALRRIREYEAYNRMIEHNNQPVDFPITRGELKLIYMGLNELTKVKPYKVTANVRSNWEEQRSYKRIIIDDLMDRAFETIYQAKRQN